MSIQNNKRQVFLILLVFSFCFNSLNTKIGAGKLFFRINTKLKKINIIFKYSVLYSTHEYNTDNSSILDNLLSLKKNFD